MNECRIPQYYSASCRLFQERGCWPPEGHPTTEGSAAESQHHSKAAKVSQGFEIYLYYTCPNIPVLYIEGLSIERVPIRTHSFYSSKALGLMWS